MCGYISQSYIDTAQSQRAANLKVRSINKKTSYISKGTFILTIIEHFYIRLNCQVSHDEVFTHCIAANKSYILHKYFLSKKLGVIITLSANKKIKFIKRLLLNQKVLFKYTKFIVLI